MRDFGADLVLGQAEKFEIDRYLLEKGRFVSSNRLVPMEKTAIDTQKDRTRFFFKIQDGCDKFCSYCIVPLARGAGRSRPADDVAATMEAVLKSGIKEVVLTGIDIAAYRDPASGMGLKDLLLSFDRLPTPPRIRLSSVDPDYLDDAFIEVLAASGKVAKSIHIPVQSGSDGILKAMGRRYGSAFIAGLVKDLKKRIPSIGIGIDIMAGFPGEDAIAFDETCAFIEALDVSYLHVFPYSERPGARAAAFGGKVAESVKRRRVKKLKEIDAAKREAFSRHHLGMRVCIIPEAKMYAGRFMRGFSDNYLPVYIPYEKTLENNLVDVTITDMQESRLIGGFRCS
jgi:threonylcarbamoyladenosine tRNA methylthiotransferase MtaB